MYVLKYVLYKKMDFDPEIIDHLKWILEKNDVTQKNRKFCKKLRCLFKTSL